MIDNNDIYIFTLDCSRSMDSIGVIANTQHYLEEQADIESEDFGIINTVKKNGNYLKALNKNQLQ